MTKKAARAELLKVNERLGLIQEMWSDRGVVEGEWEEHRALLDRRLELANIIKPTAAPQVDSLIR